MSAWPGATRRTVSVLFCDIVDSTPLGERLDPETYRRVQTGYFEAVRTVLERHGGTVEKYIGDAVMAVFGLPELHEDDALRAVRAASELRAAVAPLDEELARDHSLRLRLRAGVATGEVVADDPSGGHGFLTGDTVVVAERLERAAEPSTVLVEDTTYRLTAGAAIVEAVDPVPAKGKSQPVAAWRLIGVREGVPALQRRLDTPLVGRREELDRLRAAYEEAAAHRRCRLVALLGPAGIGKSRLTLELLDDLRDQATVLLGRCPPYGDGITFWPIADIFPDERFDRSADEIFRRVRSRMEELARERPLVVCFEDVHWGEPTFLRLLEYLAGWISDVPVLLLCLARPELFDRAQLHGAETIVLEPLAPTDAGALLELLEAPEDARARIAAAAEGNPLFVEQMAALAAEGGPLDVPASIRALLAARLDRLTRDERAAIERAAVIGRDFTLEAVAALSEGDVTGPLLSLVHKELLRPAGFEDGLRFRHGLIRETAYEATPKTLRAELHERHARRLARADEPAVVVGYHLEQAYLTREALGPSADRALALEAGALLGAAGERAFRRNDMPASITLLERALALLRPHGPRVPELAAELANALTKSMRFEEADVMLEEAIDAARAAGDRRTELRAVVERQQLRSFSEPAGVVDEIAEVAAEVIPVLEDLGDDAGLAKAWRLMSDAHLFACRWQARAEALERAIEHARRTPEAQPDAGAFIGLLAGALHFGPTPAEEAIARCESFLKEAGDDEALRAAVSGTLGPLLAMRGRFDEARAAYAESVALHDQLGLKLRRVVFALHGAEIEALAGDPAAAERELRPAYDALEQMGDTSVLPLVAAALSHVQLAQGRDEEAARFAELAAARADPDDVAAQGFQRIARARVHARRGEPSDAELLAREAAELAAGTDYLSLQASAALAVAETLLALGRREEAGDALAQARTLYEQKGNTVEAERIAAAEAARTTTTA